MNGFFVHNNLEVNKNNLSFVLYSFIFMNYQVSRQLIWRSALWISEPAH